MGTSQTQALANRATDRARFKEHTRNDRPKFVHYRSHLTQVVAWQ